MALGRKCYIIFTTKNWISPNFFLKREWVEYLNKTIVMCSANSCEKLKIQKIYRRHIFRHLFHHFRDVRR